MKIMELKKVRVQEMAKGLITGRKFPKFQKKKFVPPKSVEDFIYFFSNSFFFEFLSKSFKTIPRKLGPNF